MRTVAISDELKEIVSQTTEQWITTAIEIMLIITQIMKLLIQSLQKS